MNDPRDLATAELTDLPEITTDLATTPAGPRSRRLLDHRWAGPGATFVALAGSTVLCFWAKGPLWLDEAQTVAIARRSFPHGIVQGLHQDGSPPLYYFLLHVWMAIVGTSTFAVRSLSGVFALASVALIAVAARRLGGFGVPPRTAALLFATCPFVLRYATETRMYSFELFLVLLAVLAFDWLWSRGGRLPTIAAGVVSGALLLTQYWALYALVLLGAIALVAAVRGVRKARLVVVALLIGAAVFSPWLPNFLFQSKHTGAPWAAPPGLDEPINVIGAWTGGGLSAVWLRLAYYALILVAIAGFAGASGGLTFRRPIRRLPTAVFGFAIGTLLFGTILSEITSNAFAPRYTMAVLPLVVLVIAAGVAALPERVREGALIVLCALGLIAAGKVPTQLRTQAGQVAAYLKLATPNSTIAFCPDQLGPAVHRLVPDVPNQVVYPDFRPSATVNWIGYKSRVEDADPGVFTQQLLQRAKGAPIWYVYMPGYPIFKQSCETVFDDLTAARGLPLTYINSSGAFEHDQLVEFLPN